MDFHFFFVFCLKLANRNVLKKKPKNKNVIVIAYNIHQWQKCSWKIEWKLSSIGHTVNHILNSVVFEVGSTINKSTPKARNRSCFLFYEYKTKKKKEFFKRKTSERFISFGGSVTSTGWFVFNWIFSECMRR